MSRVLSIILLMLMTLTLRGAEGRALVSPAPISVGEKLELYAYSYLGVEVRSFTDEEFVAYRRRLAPPPVGNGIHMVPGEAAYLRGGKRGLLITRVVPGSPAERGGLEAGDVMISTGGARTDTPVDLLTIMRNCAPDCTMHMMLIGRDLRWKYAMPVPEALSTPARVGHITPLALNKENQWRMKTHQANAIRMLAMEKVPIKEVCDELEAICRLIYKGYTPGSLLIPLRTGDCTITATRYAWNIDVTMEVNGSVTTGSLRRWVWEKPGQALSPARPGPDVLPESIRQRLQEIDVSAPRPPSRWDEI